MKYIPSLRSFTSVFFNELLFNISKSTTMRFEVKTRSIEHMHIFFVFSSSFPFSFWIWDAWSLRFLCFFSQSHYAQSLSSNSFSSPHSYCNITLVLSFFLFYLFVYTFVTSSQSVETTNCHCSIRRDLTSNVFSLTFLHFYSSFLQIAKALLLTASNTREKKRTHYILNNETWWLFDGWQFN